MSKADDAMKNLQDYLRRLEQAEGLEVIVVAADVEDAVDALEALEEHLEEQAQEIMQINCAAEEAIAEREDERDAALAAFDALNAWLRDGAPESSLMTHIRHDSPARETAILIAGLLARRAAA